MPPQLDDERRDAIDRREEWGKLDRYIRWQHFYWIAGGLVAAGVIINSFLWQQAEEHNNALWGKIHSMEISHGDVLTKQQVVMNRLDHFLDSREYLVESVRRDMHRLEDKLDHVDMVVQTIEVDIGRLHGAKPLP